MKKVLKIVGIVILLLLALIIILPIAFKGKIFELIQEEANKNLNAQVEIGDVGLSLIENFPDFTLTVEALKVTGVDEFDGVVLADIAEIKASVDLMSVISGDELKIHTVGLTKPQLHVIVTPEGKANYDIAKASEEAEEEPVEEAEEPETEEGGSLEIQINEYYIREAHVIYDDQQGDMYAELTNFTHEGRGDFTLDNFLFETRTTADGIEFRMDGIRYLKQVRTDITFNFQMDMVNSKYTFMENEVNLNDLSLQFDGWVQMPDEAIDMDLTFGTKQTEFKALLSLVPDAYTADFADIQTSGTLALKGMAKGRYEERGEDMLLPAFDVSLLVNDARFQYPDLPKSAENIQIDIRAQNPGGEEDATIIDINQFHVEMAENPIDVEMHIKTPVSDPDIDGLIQAQVNLASLSEVIPMEEGESYSGSFTSDIALKGRLSAIEEERYEDFQAAGNLIILDFNYQSPDLPYDVLLNKMYMKFSPEYVQLSTFEAVIGESDLSANGRIDNMLAYYFRDDPLTGSFTLNSNYLNLNEFMTDEEESEASEAPESPESEEAETPEDAETESDSAGGVFEVPSNINFTLNTLVRKMIYDKIEITDVEGKVVLADSKLSMDKLAMQLLNGSLNITGSYATVDPKEPEVDFALDIRKFDIEQTVAAFNTVERLAPILKSAKGAFSTDLSLAGKMDDRMEMKLNTLNGKGILKTHNVRVDNPILEKMDKALKIDKFNPLAANDLDIEYEIQDGRLETMPFELKQGGINNIISGYSTLDQKINYTIDSEIPTDAFGSTVSQVADNLLGQLKSAGIDPGELPDKVKVSTKVEGDVNNPSIKPNFGGKGGSGSGGSLKDKVEQGKEKLKEKAGEKADKLLEDAQEQADKIVAKASEQADKLREEGKKAADKIREEADKQAQGLVDNANNPIAKIAAEKGAEKLRKEADKQAQKVEAEANEKADQVEAKAREEADKILEDAREKAEQQTK